MTVAGITTELVCDDPSLRLSLPGPVRHFVVPDAEPEVTVRVGLGELRQECDAEPIFDSGAVWQLYRQADRFLFRFRSPAFGPLPYKTACFNPSFSAGEVWLHRPYFEARGPVYPLEYPLDELLIINRLAAQGQGVEIHACGGHRSLRHGLPVCRSVGCWQDHDGQGVAAARRGDNSQR